MKLVMSLAAKAEIVGSIFASDCKRNDVIKLEIIALRAAHPIGGNIAALMLVSFPNLSPNCLRDISTGLCAPAGNNPWLLWSELGFYEMVYQCLD